ncbi:MAG: SDR family NAD(P)-dependent oxidoreductase [Solimonas sp.]
MQSVVITGASTGIGWAVAKALLDRGYRVFGSVRKQADAERLAREFGPSFEPLIFDVTDEEAVGAAAARVRAALGGRRLAGLINNAGIAVPGPLLYLPIEDFRAQLETNLVGTLIATQAFAPMLGVDEELAGPPGRLINMSSAAGKRALPFMGPYACSKHGLEAVSESLRRELMPFGILVCVIGPGAVQSAIWDKAEQVDISKYRGTPYAGILEKARSMMVEGGKRGLPAEMVGRVAYEALTAPRPQVRYVLVPNHFQNWILPKLLPRPVLDRMIAKRLGLDAIGLQKQGLDRPSEARDAA